MDITMTYNVLYLYQILIQMRIFRYQMWDIYKMEIIMWKPTLLSGFNGLICWGKSTGNTLKPTKYWGCCLKPLKPKNRTKCPEIFLSHINNHDDYHQHVSGPLWMLPYTKSTECNGIRKRIGPSAHLTWVPCLPRALLGPSPEGLDNTSCKLCCKICTLDKC